MKEYRHGGDIYSNTVDYDFSANINPLGMPKEVAEAAKKAVEDCCHYPDPHCRQIKSLLAKKEKVTEDSIVFGNGAADLVYRFVLAKKPQTALVLSPTFSEYEDALQTVGCKVERHCLKKENGFAVTDDFLEELQTGLEVVFLCNPNNPTGQLIDLERMKQIVERTKKLGIFLFVDECFLDFVEDGEGFSLIEQTQKEKHIFVLRAFTKMFAMAGLRLGYGISGEKKLLAEMEKVCQSWPVSTVAQAAGETALGMVGFLEKTREYVARERAFLKQGLEALGFWVVPSCANYLLFQGDLDLYEKMLEKRILIRSCHTYWGLGKGYFRIAVKSREENKALLLGLKECIGVEKTWEK